MKVLITGSRSWNDVKIVADVLQKLPAGTVIVHGDARGADTVANAVAEELGFKIERFPVTKEDWEKYGRSAGHRRNKKMLLESNPDLVIAFLNKSDEKGSPGTRGMIEISSSYGKRVIVIEKELCATCGVDYDSSEGGACSDGYHCCRDCTWVMGEVTVACKQHAPNR